MARINNPFIVYGYKGPEYFCDREEETQKIYNALHNERNVTLVAPRRMGKTGLIHHVFNYIKEMEPDTKCFYIDIFPTRNLAQLVQMLANTVIGELDNPAQGVMRRVQEFFGAWRPTVTFDQITGLPSISLDIKPQEEAATLKQVFEYMKHSGKRCYVAIDEFQQILEYSEKGTEAIIRSYMQFLPNVYFIFSGSLMHVMTEMFTSANRPFFQSSQIIRLTSVDKEKYLKFANDFFDKQDRAMTPELFDYIYSRMDGITFYIQAILNRLYEMTDEPLSHDSVDRTISTLVEERKEAFLTYYASLTATQADVIRAIAQEQCVREPLSHQFISRHRLKATSSVKTALKALTDRQLTYLSSEGYVVYDKFFDLWLRTINI